MSGGAMPVGTRRGKPLHAAGYAGDLRLRVLVIEPDAGARSILQTRLAGEGFECLVAANAEEALRTMGPDSALPAVIVCEAQLPGTDGFVLCGQLRSDERTAHIPVMMLSARPDEAHAQRAQLASADEHLPKPLFANDLVSLVKLMAGQLAAGTFEANTHAVPLAGLVRALVSGSRPGRITLTQGSGQLVFREHRIIEAHFDGVVGREAIARMLVLAEGGYQVRFGASLGRASFAVTLEELCERIFPRLARWQALLAQSVPLTTRLEVHFATLAQVLAQLPEDVNGVLRLFDGVRTVRDVLVESSLNEITSLEVVSRLSQMGVLVPATERPKEIPGSSPRLKLFEPSLDEVEEKMRSLFGDALPTPPQPQEPASYDWFSDPAQWAAELPTVTDPAEGWVAEPVAQSAAQRHLEAFAPTPVADRPAAPPPAGPLVAFARGDLDPAGSVLAQSLAATTPVEDAFFSQEAGSAEESTQRYDTLQPDRRETSSWLRAAGIVVAVALVSSGVGLVAVRTWIRRTAQVRVVPPVVVAAPAAAAAVVEPVVAIPAAVVPGPTLEEGVQLYNDGKSAEAAAVLAQVTEAQPDSAQAWSMLGQARYDAGDDVGAQDAALRAEALDPKNGRVLMLLATIDLDRGDAKSAQTRLARYLELEPTGPYAQEARVLLAQYAGK